MTLEEIAAARLRIQGLRDARFGTPAEVVGWFGAVQSQEYAVARWSLGERSAGAAEGAVEDALADGTILRTHILRPTWHYVLPEDLRWMQAVAAPRVRGMMASYDRALELTPEVYARSAAVIEGELAGGRHRTRTQLGEALGAAGIEARGQRLGHLMMRAELDALICSGAAQGRQTTYALVAERAPLPAARDLAGDEALAELARRYFTSHGPATLRDFRWWSSLTAAEAKRAVAMLEGELEQVDADGRRYWWSPGADPAGEGGLTAHLLQAYDEYIVAYTESRDALDIGRRIRFTGERAQYLHLLVVGGQGVGRWRRRTTGKQVRIDLQFVRKLRKAEQGAVDAAVERYTRFIGGDET